MQRQIPLHLKVVSVNMCFMLMLVKIKSISRSPLSLSFSKALFIKCTSSSVLVIAISSVFLIAAALAVLRPVVKARHERREGVGEMLRPSAEHRRCHVHKSVRQHHCLMPRNYGIFFPPLSFALSLYHCFLFPFGAGTVGFKAHAPVKAK